MPRGVPAGQLTLQVLAKGEGFSITATVTGGVVLNNLLSSLGALGKIRSGPQVGKVATSPLPYRGSPPLQSGGQNQKWPTSGRNGYLTPAVSGIPTA